MERRLEDPTAFVPRLGTAPPPVGRTPTVLLRSDGAGAYPVVDGIPILLAPEVLMASHEPPTFDLSDERYAEAYEEMDHYNAVGADGAWRPEASPLRASLADAQRAAATHGEASFPRPPDLWIEATYDPAAQWDAYAYLAPLSGKRVLQIGGSGSHALKFLLAGASEAWLLSPMVGELRHAKALAAHFGLTDRFACAAGVAEELPFKEASFDAIFAGGCAHHFVTHLAFPECARVLRPSGRFAAVEPWRAPLYSVGTRIFGKREPNVYCRPLTSSRARPLFQHFTEARITHHGTLTRYPLIALGTLGLQISTHAVWRITRLDDALCSLLPSLRRLGSSVALLASR